MLKIIGIVVTALGVLSALVGWGWQLFFPTIDANIGAGGLVVLGIPLAAVGLVLLIIGLVIERRKVRR